MRFFKKPTLLFLLPLMLSAYQNLHADEQGWLNHSATFNISAEFSLKLYQETRCQEITFMDPYLKNWQGGLVYHLPKNFYVAALYKHENVEKTIFTLTENRFTLESGWKTNLKKDLDFDYRFRTEIRRYNHGLAENHLRFRFRVRLKTIVSLGSLTIIPFIATEPFADTVTNKINRNRFYLGAIFPLSEKAELIINYIRQDTKGAEAIHILNSGLDLKF